MDMMASVSLLILVFFLSFDLLFSLILLLFRLIVSATGYYPLN